MDYLGAPPWNPAANERRTLDHEAFQQGESALQTLASSGNGSIANELYTFSKQWGKIVRANVTFSLKGSSATWLVICWLEADGGVNMAMQIDDRRR